MRSAFAIIPDAIQAGKSRFEWQIQSQAQFHYLDSGFAR